MIDTNEHNNQENLSIDILDERMDHFSPNSFSQIINFVQIWCKWHLSCERFNILKLYLYFLFYQCCRAGTIRQLIHELTGRKIIGKIYWNWFNFDLASVIWWWQMLNFAAFFHTEHIQFGDFLLHKTRHLKMRILTRFWYFM